MKKTVFYFSLVIGFLSVGCTGVPEGLLPVDGFEPQRYIGKWYEIARLDHRFERGLSDVSAVYAKNEDDSLSVVNRGFDVKSGAWKQISGKARFIKNESIGSLKVSFFGPFYGGYHIIELDRENYRYAMVAGASRSYLWILSRTRSLPPRILSNLVNRAAILGFKTDELIFVRHDRPDE